MLPIKKLVQGITKKATKTVQPQVSPELLAMKAKAKEAFLQSADDVVTGLNDITTSQKNATAGIEQLAKNIQGMLNN